MMFTKQTLKSKTFWIGVLGLLGGVGLILNGQTEDGIKSILASLAVICGRDAISKLKP